MTDPRKTYRVTVRDPLMVEVAPLGRYTEFTADLRLMLLGGPGTFTVTVPTYIQRDGVTVANPGLDPLFDGDDPIEGMGLVVRDGTSVVCSGDIVDGTIDDSPGGTTVLICEEDDTRLRDDIAQADPDTDIPTSATATSAAQDIRTGPGGEIIAEFLAANIGPAAGVVRRRYPWLDIPAPTGVGTSGTWKARDDVLADLANTIAANSGVAWRLLQHPTLPKLTVHIWEPVQLDGITFSPKRGGVGAVPITYKARTVTEVVVAADIDVDRVRTRRAITVPAGHRRRVKWRTTSSTDLADMRQPADQDLTDGAATSSASVSLNEVPGAEYGRDWSLGDIATAASWRRATVTALVVGAHIEHRQGQPRPRVTASIGALDPTLPTVPADQVRRLLDAYLRAE